MMKGLGKPAALLSGRLCCANPLSRISALSFNLIDLSDMSKYKYTIEFRGVQPRLVLSFCGLPLGKVQTGGKICIL